MQLIFIYSQSFEVDTRPLGMETPAMTTQKDIARTLGVSVTLVSRALSGKAGAIGIPDRTVQQILETATAMGYVPNATARMLKGSPTRTIGVVVYDFEDPFLGVLIGELQHLAHAAEYSLVLVGFEHRHVDPAALRPLSKHGVDGLIVVGSSRDFDWLSTLSARRLPVARIGTGPVVDGMLSVSVDHEAGMELLVGHLAARGYKTAGFVSDDHPAHADRQQRFMDSLPKHGLATRPEWLYSMSGDTAAPGITPFASPRAGALPDALVCASDMIAIAALRSLREIGMTVPGNIAVTGFDDIPLAPLVCPSLTTIRQPVPDMARTAFDWVLRSDKGPKSPSPVVFKPTLVVRESA